MRRTAMLRRVGAPGKPMYPAPGQYAAIKTRDGLELLSRRRSLLMDGKVKISFRLPVHGISLLVVSPECCD